MGQPRRKEKEELATDSSAAEPAAPVDAGPWKLPARLSRVSIGVIVGVALLINLPLLHYFLWRGQVPATVALPFRDDFSSVDTVEKNYSSTGGSWRVVNGELLSPGVKNNPLWLKASLPQNVAVEFDVRSTSPEGDIKVEIFGDGSDHASGYILIHGGWNNSISIIARMDEHAPSMGALQAEAMKRGGNDVVQAGVYRPDTRVRIENNPYPVQIGKQYHWRIERREKTLIWIIDGREFMRFEDPYPLAGKWHDRFGFSSWEAQLYFDNFKVEPL